MSFTLGGVLAMNFFPVEIASDFLFLLKKLKKQKGNQNFIAFHATAYDNKAQMVASNFPAERGVINCQFRIFD